MQTVSWPCPLTQGGECQEYALAFDRARPIRLMIIPALFDESNKLRRLTVSMMRHLDGTGIDSFLPDLPGCNESMQPLAEQTSAGWLAAMIAAGRHFQATHALGLRGGCLFTPDDLPALHYAPVRGAPILRQMLRARVLSAREAGREEHREALEQDALSGGITLSGYSLGASLYRDLGTMEPGASAEIIGQEELGGGSGLWLRAEPDDNPQQAQALAAIVAQRLGR